MEELVLTRERPSVRFRVEIDGSQVPPSARLFLRKSDKISLCLDGEVMGDLVVVQVPLEAWDGPEKADATLEVEVEGQVFRPWQGKISFPKLVKVAAAPDKDRGSGSGKQIKARPAEEPLDEVGRNWRKYI